MYIVWIVKFRCRCLCILYITEPLRYLLLQILVTSLALVLAIMVTQSQQVPCRKHLKAKKTLKHVRRNYMLLEKTTIGKVLAFPRPRRYLTSDSITDSKYCPWRWVRDTSLTSSRFGLMKAQCIGRCKSYCKPIYYTMKVLVKKGRDARAKMNVWRIVSKRIVVAYVYNDKIWSNQERETANCNWSVKPERELERQKQ